MSGGGVEQRGAGERTLCERCDNNTGSWYGNELVLAARAGVRILREVPLDEFDALLEPRYADLRIMKTETSPHPLRLIKQIVTMLLATSPPDLTLSKVDLERRERVLAVLREAERPLRAGQIAERMGGISAYAVAASLRFMDGVYQPVPSAWAIEGREFDRTALPADLQKRERHAAFERAVADMRAAGKKTVTVSELAAASGVSPVGVGILLRHSGCRRIRHEKGQSPVWSIEPQASPLQKAKSEHRARGQCLGKWTPRSAPGSVEPSGRNLR